MKLIIDVPDEEYKTLSRMSEKEKVNELSYYERVIANGTPCDILIEELESRMDYGIEYAQAMYDVIAILERREEE